MGMYYDVKVVTTQAGYEEFLSLIPVDMLEADTGLFWDEGRPEYLAIDGDTVRFGWWDVKWELDWGLDHDGRDPFADVKAAMAAIQTVIDHGVNSLHYQRMDEDGWITEELGRPPMASQDVRSAYARR